MLTKSESLDQSKAKGVLVDLTKCIGCGSCVVACKMYNKNEWVDDRALKPAPTSGEAAKLADANWTVVQKCRIGAKTGESLPPSPLHRTNGTEVWRFVKRQCLHCKEPACASSCFATAFRKTESGPVVYYPNLCVGCRYCMLACPFSVPKFEWNNPLPAVTKCSMCSRRVENGDAPACVTVCPTNVMKFGNHEDLLREAKDILAKDSRYVKHIYGEEEAGGTMWIYISDKPFDTLGFKTDIPKQSFPAKTSTYMHNTPLFGLAWFVVLSCLYLITGRRAAVKKKKEAKKSAETKPKT